MKKFFSSMISDTVSVRRMLENPLKNPPQVTKEALENKMRIERLLKNPQYGKPITKEEMVEMSNLQDQTSDNDRKFSSY